MAFVISGKVNAQTGCLPINIEETRLGVCLVRGYSLNFQCFVMTDHTGPFTGWVWFCRYHFCSRIVANTVIIVIISCVTLKKQFITMRSVWSESFASNARAKMPNQWLVSWILLCSIYYSAKLQKNSLAFWAQLNLFRLCARVVMVRVMWLVIIRRIEACPAVREQINRKVSHGMARNRSRWGEFNLLEIFLFDLCCEFELISTILTISTCLTCSLFRCPIPGW